MRSQDIARIARDEFYLVGGHRIDSNGRLFSFGVVESEQEEDPDHIPNDDYRFRYLGWWHVLRYWHLLANIDSPAMAAQRFLTLRGFKDALASARDSQTTPLGLMNIGKALAAVDALPQSAADPEEREILKEALIRAAINDVAWSAAFVGAVMRQAGLDSDMFAYSRSHRDYIYKAFATSAADAEGAASPYLYRACPPERTMPRLGDLLCYHRNEKTLAGRSRAGIRDAALAERTAPDAERSVKKAHCDFVAHVDLTAHRVYVVGGNVQQSVTVKKLVLRRSDNTLLENQPDGCGIDGAWTFPKAEPGKPIAPHLSNECSLNRKQWFVLLQARM